MGDRMKVVDLFSGLGGFSEGFLQRGHEIIRYDNNPRFEAVPDTIIRDVFDLKIRSLRNADVILASPPCQCFSSAAGGHYWEGRRPKLEATETAIRLIKHTLKLIHAARPRYWVIENPVGRLRWFLGPPSKITYWAAWGMPYYKPTHLWGLLPDMVWPKPTMWEPAPQGSHQGVAETNGQVRRKLKRFYPPELVTTWAIGHLPTRNAKNADQFSKIEPRAEELRALIPLRFSLALAEGCEKEGGQVQL